MHTFYGICLLVSNPVSGLNTILHRFLNSFRSCFSSVLLPHLLLGGMKDFYVNSYKKDGIYVNEDSITSGVIRVLNYIAVQHPSEIRVSLLKFFSVSASALRFVHFTVLIQITLLVSA